MENKGCDNGVDHLPKLTDEEQRKFSYVINACDKKSLFIGIELGKINIFIGHEKIKLFIK